VLDQITKLLKQKVDLGNYEIADCDYDLNLEMELEEINEIKQIKNSLEGTFEHFEK